MFAKPGTEHPLLPEYPMLNKDNLINVLGVTKDTKGDRWYKVSITKKNMLAMYQPNISLRHKEVRHGY